MRKLFASRAFKRKLWAGALALALLPLLGGCSGDSTPFAIDIQETIPLTVETNAMQAGTVGTVYTYSLSARGGGNLPGVPYVWTQVSVGGAQPKLPLGLSLNQNGSISGIPRQRWDPAVDGKVRFRVSSTDGSISFTPEMDFLVVGESWAPSPGLSNGATSAPFRRSGHSAVWVDVINGLPSEQMIVWGGYGVKYNRVNPADVSVKDYLQDGGLYTQIVDNWSLPDNLRAEAPADVPNNLPAIVTGAPSARAHHSAVYTGSEMIVWGGENAGGLLNNGGSYNTATGVWSTSAGLAGAGAPSARREHTAVWNSNAQKMYVFGGITAGGPTNEVWSYDPATDVWAPVVVNGTAPTARYGAVMGYDSLTNRMIVWGGTNGTINLRNGHILDIPGNTWTQPNTLTTASAEGPTVRRNACGAMYGSRFVVWGGEDAAGSLNNGDIFDMAAFRWTSASDPGSTNGLAMGSQRPSIRHSASAVATAHGILFWGGIGIQAPTNMNEEWGEGRVYVPK